MAVPRLAALAFLGLTAAAHPSTWTPLVDGECIAAPYDGAGTPRAERLSALTRALRSALEEFPSLLRTLDTTQPELCLSGALVLEKAFFDPAENRIYLAEDMPPGLMLVVLVHELRHADQFARGICPSQALAMKSYARGVLALEADANVVAHLVAWRLGEAGDRRAWEALESWPSTTDIAERFAETMDRGGTVADAASAAFDQWYLSEARRSRYYAASCSAYLDQQDAADRLPTYLQLSDDYLDRLCVLPDGSRYTCADRGQGGR